MVFINFYFLTCIPTKTKKTSFLKNHVLWILYIYILPQKSLKIYDLSVRHIINITEITQIEKTNWAQKIDKGPFKAFPVTGGITFTYGGLKIDKNGSVLDINNNPIKGLFSCGELVGGVFFNGYPGGSGLTSGAVFGRIAGYGSVQKG